MSAYGHEVERIKALADAMVEKKILVLTSGDVTLHLSPMALVPDLKGPEAVKELDPEKLKTKLALGTVDGEAVDPDLAYAHTEGT